MKPTCKPALVTVTGLMLLLTAPVACAVDVVAFCQDQVPANARRAAWGLEMRSEMLAACVDQNLRQCSQPWRDRIVVQERADQEALAQKIGAEPMSRTRQWLLEAATRQLTEAAYMALRGVAGTPGEIADEILQECLRQEQRDLDAQRASGTSPVQPYPVCTVPRSAAPGYVERCCSPDCYCEFYCE